MGIKVGYVYIEVIIERRNNMDREYLLDRDRIYTTGCFLKWDNENQKFLFDGLEGGTEHFDGNEVYLDGVNRPYVERENI